MTNDIRKFLNLLESPIDVDSSITECMDNECAEWYNTASNTMIQRIKAGEYPIDVINELAREYSWKKGGTYESFAFARDALDRRAWEMGLRYTDDSVDSENIAQGYHDTLISPRITETGLDEDAELNELIYEAGLVDKIIARMAPDSSAAARVASDAQFKKLASNSYNNFMKKFSFGDGRNITFNNAIKYLNKADIHPKFLEKVIKEFKSKFPEAGSDQEDKSMIKKLFVAVAAEIMIEGGPGEVTKSAYGDGSNDTSPSNDTSDDQDSSETPNKKTGYKTIKNLNDADKLTNKALSDSDSLTSDEIYDLGVLIKKLRNK